MKTSLAPGSRVVTDYYDQAGLTPYLDKLGFNLVGYGCTTCIGNSGPLIAGVSRRRHRRRPGRLRRAVRQPQLRGPHPPRRKMNYLASPPLVVAYALAGSMDIDLTRPAGHRQRRAAGVPARHLAVASRDRRGHRFLPCSRRCSPASTPQVFAGDERWQSLATPAGDTFAWEPGSTYVRRPPYFEGMDREPGAAARHRRARGCSPCSATRSPPTTSPPPARSAQDSPAGRYLRRARGAAGGLQLLRVAPRQPRGDDPRHVRQHPAAQPAGPRHRGRRTPATCPAATR